MRNRKFFAIVLFFAILLFAINFALIHSQQNKIAETKIEIKVSGDINETQKAKVNELLNYFKNQNPHLKIESKIKKEKTEIKRTKIEKYHFIEIFSFGVIVVFILCALFMFKKKERNKIRILTNIVLCLIFLVSSLSGILLIYEYKFQGLDIKFWHVIVSLFLFFIIIYHIALHWNTWISYFKRLIINSK